MSTLMPGSGRLSADDLLSLEKYSKARNAIRTEMIAHKRLRTIGVGRHATLVFEDRFTVQYQIQEMLRTERIFESEGIQDELDAYNPLIPDGTNLKATFLIEYPDPEQRAEALRRLKGIERRCYMAVGDERVYAIADEDLERENEEKTSAVHFLRFEFSPAARRWFIEGARVTVGTDHPEYLEETELSVESVRTLAADFVP
jgi:hypothetical protein